MVYDPKVSAYNFLCIMLLSLWVILCIIKTEVRFDSLRRMGNLLCDICCRFIPCVEDDFIGLVTRSFLRNLCVGSIFLTKIAVIGCQGNSRI